MAEDNLSADFRAFEYLTDALVIVDEKLKVVYLNKAAIDFYNIIKEDVIGSELSELFSEEWLTPEEKEAYITCLTQKGAWSGEYYLVNSNGQKFPVSASISNLKNASGKKLGTIYLMHQDTNKQQNDPLPPSLDLSKQELANIIDAQALQSMMDNIYAVTKIGFAVIDLNGNILAANGWQDICTKFHRVNPQSLWNCLESDLELTQGVAAGEFRAYKCKNNMWDFVTPIMIGNKHVGNLFAGQFFFDDETIDQEVFAQQAEKYGFNKEAYLAALDKVPRRNREEIKHLMQFYVNLAEMISKLSYSNLRLSKSLSDQKKIERELRQRQHDLNHAQDVAKTGSWRINVKTNELVWSDEVYRMFGIPLGTPLTYEKFLKTIHPDDKEFVDNTWKAAMRGERYDIEHRILVDDEVAWVHEKAELEFDIDGTLIAGFGTTQDITQHKFDEERLQRLNRALRAISDGNQAITRATEEAAFVHQACRIVVEDCGYALVWIGFAIDDEQKTVKPIAYAGFDQGYIDSLKITWNDTERGRGPTGTAIRTGKMQVCNDMCNDPKFAPWRKQALERGYASSVVLPLMANGKAFGALNIYSPEVNTFGDEEVKLLSELANDFAHGITLLRTQAANKKAQELVQITLKRFYDSLSSMHGGILLVSDQEKVEFANQAFCDYFNLKETPEQLKELSAERVIKKIKTSYLHPEQELTRINEIIECSEPVLGEEVKMQNNRTCLRDFIPLKATEGASSFSRLWHHMDITPQKSAEETLLKSRGEWERTFDALPDYIAVIDNKHRILRVNKAMADKLGVKKEQCFGMRCYACVHEKETWPKDCPHTKSLSDGKIHVAELFEEKLGGDLIITTTPLKDEKGNIVGTVHIARVKSKNC